ncbi:hypothetical protein B0J12DRAFT_690606 [Macrophomina phaseolina]|uniref:MADS-box domain-containing protein n=1 Tax=Macrophomina phaseolina TaxID=35725 RepID=A0ABQ8FQG5_9PEZI|nr:hypothetical protein B0J12DRAFT_690606 [Macrophomina phaseolina]
MMFAALRGNRLDINTSVPLLASQNSILAMSTPQLKNGRSHRVSKERFRKRKESLLRKGDELRRLCQAEVHILLRYHGRYYVYTSDEKTMWPSHEDIAKCYPVPVTKTPTTMNKLQKPPSPTAEWVSCTGRAECRANGVCRLGQNTGRAPSYSNGYRCASINTAEQLPCDRGVQPGKTTKG